MSFIKLASNMHDLARRITGVSPEAQVLFMLKKPSPPYDEIGTVTGGFFIEQEKTKEGENILWFRFPNTPENFALYKNSNCIVPQKYNHLYDDLILDLNKTYFAPSSLSFVRVRLNPTLKKYPLD